MTVTPPPDPSPLAAAQVLEDAADLMLVHGRCVGVGHDAEGRYCALGAIKAASGESDPERWWTFHSSGARAAIVALAQRMAYRRPKMEVTQRVYEWNDETDDDDMVRDAFLLAAKDLRATAAPI